MKHAKELLARWNWILENHHHDEGPSITIRDAIVSLEVAIRQDDTPQVIRTVEELEALEELDGDARLITRSGLCRSARWFNAVLGNEIGYTMLLPFAVVATGEEMREARKALEEADA